MVDGVPVGKKYFSVLVCQCVSITHTTTTTTTGSVLGCPNLSLKNVLDGNPDTIPVIDEVLKTSTTGSSRGGRGASSSSDVLISIPPITSGSVYYATTGKLVLH